MRMPIWTMAVVAIVISGSAAGAQQHKSGPTPEDAANFVKHAEAELEMLSHHEERAAFLNGTDETRAHTRLLEEASNIATSRRVELAKQAVRTQHVGTALG